MTGFRAKLRQFITTWLPVAEISDAESNRSPLTFAFNADDTPRFWSEDAVLRWPIAPAGPPREFPGFAKLATHDGERLAA